MKRLTPPLRYVNPKDRKKLKADSVVEEVRSLALDAEVARLSHIPSSWALAIEVMQGLRSGPRNLSAAEKASGVSMRGGRDELNIEVPEVDPLPLSEMAYMPHGEGCPCQNCRVK